MKIYDIAKQLANRINQEHYIIHYLKKVEKCSYNKGFKDAQAQQLILSGVVKSVSCGECNNTGYIIAENGDVGEDCHKCN